MKKSAVIAVTFLLLLFAGAIPLQAGDEQAQATAAAEKWLALVDGGQYGESWDTASGYFRNAVAKDQWEQTIRAVRGPLGALNSRALKSAQYANSLPGAPDGDYYVIQFTTSFTNKANAVETVTSMKEKDGSWKVAGYQIQ